MLPQDIQLTDLLTFFLLVDLVVMVIVGVVSFKTRHKKSKSEQLLEEIRDTLTQNSQGCAEKLTTKSNPDLTNKVHNALKKVVEIKREGVEEEPVKNKAKQELPMSMIDQKRIYYEIEESTEAQNDELSELNLVKNALKDGPVIKPLLKMPKHIDDLVNKSRETESPTEQRAVAASADPTILPLLPPPPPTQTTNAKENEKKESD